MVSFTCEQCQEVLKKNAVAKHYQGRCRGAALFTCIDCFKTFDRQSILGHTSCTTEEDKWHGQYAKSRRNQRNGPHFSEDKGAAPASGPPTKKQKRCKRPSVQLEHGASFKSDTSEKAGPVSKEATLQWQGDWESTVRHILSVRPGGRMAWRPLAEKAVELYLGSTTALKADSKDKETLVNRCLAEVPQDFVNKDDEFVRLCGA
ncbi:lyar-type c2hc zinc finger protein [Cystoisospora suis]|uniref:Lyar-type c2hc zinc finger protein n=1 Tax=Cystoisospora suis TaxID=483139 RepID=A0A2C6K9X9_9APIC|nr:lyar-type c2hc zinc finger protein [Cystoisospora suis]